MKNSVVNDQYLKLQKEIQKLHDNWFKQLEEVQVNNANEIAELKAPIIPQLDIKIDTQIYKSYINELFTLISDGNEEIKQQTEKILSVLDEVTLERWFKEAVAVNTFYFEKFAKDNELIEWLLFYGAENAARPFMQKIVAQSKELIKKPEHNHSCSCCGEPARLGLVNKEGKKQMLCPRCSFKWEVKMIQCAHCGAETQKVLRIDKDDSVEVQACTTCNNYSKIIDTRKLLRVDGPLLLDVKTLHLDYIAQDKGFGVEDSETTH